MNFINNISYKTLGAVSAIALTACVGLSYSLQLKKYETLKGTECYQEAITALRTHKGAIKYLGNPIKDGKILLTDVKELENKTRVSEVTVNVAGPTNNGVMYFWVNQMLDEPGKAFVSEVQLQVGKDKSKRLVIKGNSKS